MQNKISRKRINITSTLRRIAHIIIVLIHVSPRLNKWFVYIKRRTWWKF